MGGAHGFEFSAHGGGAVAHAFFVELHGGGHGAVDAHLSCGGDGVLVGGEEQEFPGKFLALAGDPLMDFFQGVVVGCVFVAVGVDGDDDFAGAFFLGLGSELFTEGVDGKADGVQQGGAAPGV